MSNYLVTGGAGYVGSTVAAHLLRDGHFVTVLDDLSTGHRAAVPARASFVHGRIQDSAPLLKGAAFDAVLHFAASSQVGESVTDPEKYWTNNVGGTLALLSAMRAGGIGKLVFSSTAAVYGEPATVPITENLTPAPTNPYGASKLAIDHAIGSFCAAYGLAAVSLRYFNVAGAWQAPDGTHYGERHQPESHLIPLILQAAAGARPSVSVYGTDYPTPDGTCVRDYIHVADLAEAHLLALDHAAPGSHLICNLGNGEGFSVRQVVDSVRRVTGREFAAVETGRRPGDPAVLVASAERARTRLGWKPTRTDLDGIVADAWDFAQGAADAAGPPDSPGNETP
jgi:UDP-glucose 4-epimerase